MNNDALDAKVKTTAVFAGVSPADKLRIIQSLHRIGLSVLSIIQVEVVKWMIELISYGKNKRQGKK